MRFHLPLIPGESPDNPALAFTVLADRFRRMMETLGHEVVTYPAEGPTPAWDQTDRWDEIGREQAAQITGDGVLCLPVGVAQRSIMDATGLPTVEYAVGYGGTCAPWRVFPSSAWMHTVIGAQQGTHTANGTWGDTVIPHPIDPAEHELGNGDGGFLLFVGRLIERKGLDVAVKIAERVGLPLKVAGSGDYKPTGPEYLGPVNPRERSELMGDAVALLAPTLYVEPFGLVAIEAQACGTPAITTDWGAFTETVAPEYRAATLEGFTQAVRAAQNANREQLRASTLERYSMDRIGPLYEKFMGRVQCA